MALDVANGTFAGNQALRDTVVRLAPGTGLRDGIERILRGRTGALIVLGHDAAVEQICDGGFHLDVAFAPTRLRELAKMDGAVVLSTDCTRIVRANVQLVPDPAIATEESGTRHRAAQRAAVQTGYPVVSVSASMSIVHAYVGGQRHLVDDAAPILARANLAIATLERYRTRLDEVLAQLSRTEIEDVATLREVANVVQRLELTRRLAIEIEQSVLELGTSGRQIALQLEDLLGESLTMREPVLRDYLAGRDPTATEVSAACSNIENISDTDLLAPPAVAAALGFAGTVEAQDEPVSARGYRMLGAVSRLTPDQIDAIIGDFGNLQTLLAASANDLQSVAGIGPAWARHVREGLSRLAEQSAERY